jgi:hypothetical protein
VDPNFKANNAFGCPVYALNRKLASGKSIPKWDTRARVGLYLVPSPRHAINMSLVPSLDTGLVSPQFHVQHDDFFETVPPNAGNLAVLSHLQNLSGLRLDGKPAKTKSKEKYRGTSATLDGRARPAAAEEHGLFVLEEDTPPPPHVLEEEDPPPSEVATAEVLETEFGPTLRRSAWTRRPTEQYMQYLEHRNMAFSASASEDKEGRRVIL